MCPLIIHNLREVASLNVWWFSGLTEHLHISFYRLWNKLPKTETIPNISINHAVLSPNLAFIRWKVHHDWVTQVTFYLSVVMLHAKKYIEVCSWCDIWPILWNESPKTETFLSQFRLNIFIVFRLLYPHQMKNLLLLL